MKHTNNGSSFNLYSYNLIKYKLTYLHIFSHFVIRQKTLLVCCRLNIKLVHPSYLTMALVGTEIYRVPVLIAVADMLKTCKYIALLSNASITKIFCLQMEDHMHVLLLLISELWIKFKTQFICRMSSIHSNLSGSDAVRSIGI